MLHSQSDARGRCDSRHLYGGRAECIGPISELAIRIGAPTHHLTIHQHRTRMGRTGRTKSYVLRRRDACNFDGDGAVGGGSIPELTFRVGPPAHHFPVCQQGTRVRRTLSNALRRRDACNFDGGGAVGGSSISELAVRVGPPAHHFPVCQQRTTFRYTLRDGHPLHMKPEHGNKENPQRAWRESHH